MKKAKKKKDTNPNKLPLCIMLAGEDHLAGVLLERIMWWWKYATVTIPKKPGVWIANKHEFWMRETRMSPDQLSRSLRRLKKSGLVERTQYWFGGVNILHLRPTQKTIEFLQAATTWPAANELIVGVQNHPIDAGKFAKPSPANLPNCNGSSKNAESGGAKSPNSNDIKTKHKIEHQIFQSGSAKQANPGKGEISTNFVSGPEEIGDFQEISVHAVSSLMSLAEATTSWIDAVTSYYPTVHEIELSAKEKGGLALIVEALGLFLNDGEDVNFQADTAAIFHFGVGHWSKWKPKQSLPNPEAFREHLEEIANGWTASGRPKVQTAEHTY